ncbi:MAG: hypothetical protein IJA98_04155 [Bacteroidaceae bacterium]|nr:hypothetical protein [Bacteroidaceae bacterium]
MKKNLRLLCLGLATAAFTASFAQAENVTSKLLNADMERGVIGWSIEFDSHIWKKTTKSQIAKPGFHGVNNAALENWKSDATSGLTDNTISQSITGLPNGTYVFGAYVGASVQAAEENREAVSGVTLFANDASVPVATNNPDAGTKWGHTAKFNVAVNVVDGTLKVGLKAEATTANFLIWDNATLYYFGDMDAAAALDEMAKIDMAATVAIADTCVAYKMQVDTLAYLNEQIAAGKALAGAADAYQVDEDVYWAIRLANKSIADYRGLSNAVVSAREVAAKEWSVHVADAVEALNALIAEADGMYETATAGRGEIADKKAALSEASALVELDSSYTNLDIIDQWIDETEPGEALGEYSEEMINRVVDLLEEVRVVLAESEEGVFSAVRAKHMCDSLYALIADVQANPITFNEFPIVLGPSETALKGYNLLDGATVNENDVVTYNSPVFRFEYPLTTVRFIVKQTGSNGTYDDVHPFFTLQSFEMFDEYGNEIELTEDDITSNACHNTLNPGAIDGAGIPGLIDDDPNTFFHSTWGVQIPDYHHIEVTLPDGEYSAFSFAMTARGTSYPHQFPAVLEITHVSESMGMLQSAITSAKALNPYQGTTPGFYKEDLTAFYNALAAAEALIDSEASEAEINAAIELLEAEQGKVEELKLFMPEPDKKYRIISAGPFFGSQGVQKALSVKNDTIYNNRLWWETASPDSAQQVFSFEVMPNDEGRDYYVVKHEATGLYISDYVDFDGIEETNAFGLSATKDTVELIPLGYGQFALQNGALAGNQSNMIHANNHSAGAGVSSNTVKWRTEAYGASAWYIRELQTLPYATKSLSDLNFQSEAITLYSGVNTLTLTADKDCAFADLIVYDALGAEIPSVVNADGTTATIVLDTAVVEAFSFAFTNAEGVATVTVDGVISKLSILQDAYDAAIAALPESSRGNEIGQVANTAEYDAAIAAAEALLANGGTDEAIQQAANDLDSAVVHLEVNLPLPDKTYFILSGLPAFKETHGVDVAIYAKQDAPAWSYVSISNPAYLWKFVETDEPVYGIRSFYLQNVATETYMGCSEYLSSALTLVAEPSATRPFQIDMQDGKVVTIRDSKWSNANLHLQNHGGGAGAYGGIVYWESTVGTASALVIVESEKYINDLVNNIEEMECIDEYVAPAKKGIFDLFGRRIDTPAAAGIYIVDGKKRVIKK